MSLIDGVVETYVVCDNGQLAAILITQNGQFFRVTYTKDFFEAELLYRKGAPLGSLTVEGAREIIGDIMVHTTAIENLGEFVVYAQTDHEQKIVSISQVPDSTHTLPIKARDVPPESAWHTNTAGFQRCWQSTRTVKAPTAA
ncbi:MAG: hypothetical protein HYZ63_02845 [Candidatus Andersenbacteria bacterium]|nr:hypothetical protein [Candidatus Andersenbacteria bacterium]